MCGRMNQNMFEKLYDVRSLVFIRKHSLDDCSRKAEDFDSFIKQEREKVK